MVELGRGKRDGATAAKEGRRTAVVEEEEGEEEGDVEKTDGRIRWTESADGQSITLHDFWPEDAEPRKEGKQKRWSAEEKGKGREARGDGGK